MLLYYMNITSVSMMQCWSAVLPFDVAKTIIQTSSDKATERNPFKVLSSVGQPSCICESKHQYQRVYEISFLTLNNLCRFTRGQDSRDAMQVWVQQL